MNMQIAECL